MNSGSYDRFYNGVLLPVIQHGSKDKDVNVGEVSTIPFISFFSTSFGPEHIFLTNSIL